MAVVNDASDGAAPRDGRRLIVVVDDDEAVRDSLGLLLESHGYAVAGFGSPIDVLDSGVPARANCLVLDVHMQPLDGIRLLATLRMRGVATPAVMISARFDAPERWRLAAADGETLLEKPFTEAALLAAIGHAVRRGPAAPVAGPRGGEGHPR